MGRIGVNFCDMCGKRTDTFAGKLILFADVKRRGGYTSTTTARSWRLCKKCLNKLTATETIGDKIKEEIEHKLDKLRIETKEMVLLK